MTRLFLFLIGCGMAAHADVIFTNLNDANPSARYGFNGLNTQSAVPDRVMNYVSIAVPFTINGTGLYQVDQVLMALSNDATFGTSMASLVLLTDDSGKPGSVLETWDHASPGSLLGQCCAVSFNISVARPILEGGVQYWLHVAPNPATYPGPGLDFTQNMLRYNNVGDEMPYLALSTTPGTFVVQTAADRFVPELLRPAMEIRGTPYVASVPEPSMLFWAVPGVGLVLFRRRAAAMR